MMDLLFAAGLSVLATAVAPAAHAAETQGLGKQLSDLVVQCSVQPTSVKDQKKIAGALVPTCNSIQKTANGFRLDLNGITYDVSGQESADADGGDLWDVQVVDLSTAQVVIAYHNVLCEGDLLFALVHDYTLIREVNQK